MPFVQARCTNCAANLEVDSAKEAAICPYCGTAYIVEKAINNFNTINNYTTNIYGNGNADFEIVGGVLKKYKGASVNVVIPDNVSIIGSSAFENCYGIQSVSIPNSVSQIESCAFSGCTGIQSLSIPDSVRKIESGAFGRCEGIRTLRIPESMEHIDDRAFGMCPNIKIIWPTTWRNKQLSKLRIVASCHGCGITITPSYLPSGKRIRLLYSGYRSGYEGTGDYYSFTGRGYHDKNPAEAGTPFLYDKKREAELNKLLEMADISKSCIEIVDLPKYVLKKAGFFSSTTHKTVREGTYKALQINIISD